MFGRLLRRRWRLVIVGLVLSGLVGVGIGGHPVPNHGVAQTQVMVDTPRSELAAADPSGVNTLNWRATLLAMLLGTPSSRALLAGKLGIKPAQLGVTDAELSTPAVQAALPVAALGAGGTPTSYSVTVGTDDVHPVVDIVATAPNAGLAVSIAKATIGALQAGSTSKDSLTVQGLRISRVSPIVSREIHGGAGHKRMVIVGFVFFLLWCVALAVGPAITNARAPSRPAQRDIAVFRS